MARERPVDSALVQTWLASWAEGELFSDAAVHHLQSLIADIHCLVVVTLDVGREPRSLVFRRVKRVLPVGNMTTAAILVGTHHEPNASSTPSNVHFDRW